VKTLICVAGIPYSKPTLEFGGLIAGLNTPEVTLLTVVNQERERAAAEAMLIEAKSLTDVPVHATKVRQGSPVEEIIQESRDGDYDMLVIGSSVVKGFLGVLLQSITRKVTSQAENSVLVVKEDRPLLRRILICTGGQQVSRSVVKAGARLARAAGAEVKLLHVADPMPAMYAGLDTMEETLAELLQSNTPIARHLRWSAEVLASYEITAELALHRGIAVNEILREASESDCDLLVIGAQVENASWLNELLISTVTPQVVDHAPCSVLVVRSKP
jgi:nucleotide-binding universal stress UspA family protein